MGSLPIPDTFNVAEYLLEKNVRAGCGESVAIVCGEEQVTYAMLRERAYRVGNALKSLGVEMENRVLLVLLDTPAFPACFLGAMAIGAVPVPVNTLLKPYEYEYLLNDSRAKVLVVHAALWEGLKDVRRTARFLREVVVVGGTVPGTLSYEDLVARASPQVEAAPTSKDDTAFWLYSSGSTGFPKGTVHLHHDIPYCVEQYAKGILGMTAADRTFSAAKLFFAYGLGNNLYFPMAVGASAVYWPARPQAEKMFEVIERYRPTVFFGVPTLYGQMLALPEAETRYDTSSLRLCVSAGEALPAEFYHQWKKRFGQDILDGIGSTEVLHIFLSNRVGDVKPGSSGRLVPGYEARVVDEGGRDVPPGEIGNLLIKGDSICAAYWNKHERTTTTILGEWIQTGDKYSQDADGYYWYSGRSDDMLKVGGIWVSPVEVENTLVMHPAVLEAAVVGATDDDGLTKPKAFVVVKPGATPGAALADELKVFVKDRLAPYKYPRWIAFVPELPKTATGKTQRFKLRAAAAG